MEPNRTERNRNEAKETEWNCQEEKRVVLFKIRLDKSEEFMLTPIKAIRAKCLECSNNQPKEIRECPITECTLFPYRFGNNPNRKGIGRIKRGMEQKQELS